MSLDVQHALRYLPKAAFPPLCICRKSWTTVRRWICQGNCALEVARGIWNSSSECKGLHLVLELWFVPGREVIWQPNLQKLQGCEPCSALGLAKVLEGLMQGSTGHKVRENHRRKSGPQTYRLEETIYPWRWKLGWGKGRDEGPGDTKLLRWEKHGAVPTEIKVCISVVLGILGSNTVPTVNERRLGKRWARHDKLLKKAEKLKW